MTPKILLVNPPIYDFTAYDFWLKPYGLLQLAGFLRGKADFKLFDYTDRLHPSIADLHIDGRRLSTGTTGLLIDLGGIAKGYAVDRCISLLQQLGVKQALVTAGGDSRMIGDRWGRPWSIGVRDPRNEDKLAAVIPLQDVAVSTSGDYQRYFEEDGIRYHHIINPTSGDSARALKLMAPTGFGAPGSGSSAASAQTSRTGSPFRGRR